MIGRPPAAVLETLRRLDEWVLVSHLNPDGDTLGCGAALVALGQQLGKKTRWMGRDPLPRRYDWLPCAKIYQAVGEDAPQEQATVWVDISDPERGLPALAESVAVNIDHHPTNPRFGQTAWVEPSASATAELVWALAKALCPRPDASVATALYVALVTDNGGFSFPSVMPESFETAAELVRHGANPSAIDLKLNHQDRPERLRLWGLCLSRLETVGEDAVMSWVTEEDFRRTGATIDETEDLVNELTRLEGANLACLAIEHGPKVRCSFRSRAPYSARRVAEQFKGGGHELAAGARCPGPLDAALAALKEALLDAQRFSRS